MNKKEGKNILKDFEESLKQMKLMREGKLPKKTWRELKKEHPKLNKNFDTFNFSDKQLEELFSSNKFEISKNIDKINQVIQDIREKYCYPCGTQQVYCVCIYDDILCQLDKLKIKINN